MLVDGVKSIVDLAEEVNKVRTTICVLIWQICGTNGVMPY